MATATTIATQQMPSARVFSCLSIMCAIPRPLFRAKVQEGFGFHNTRLRVISGG